MCMQSNVVASEEVVCLLVNLAEKRTGTAYKLVNDTIPKGAEDPEDSIM